MTLREWSFNASSIVSDTDVPIGDGAVPSIKMVDNSGSSNNRKFATIPGNTINGQTINGLNNGGFTCWAKETTTGGDNGEGLNLFGFRYIDVSNYYIVLIYPQTNKHQIIVRVAGVDTNVKSATANSGVTLAEGSWYKARVQFWEAIGGINILVELWDGSNWVAQGTPSAHAGNNHKGATNKFALGMQNGGIGSATNNMWYENFTIYKQK